MWLKTILFNIWYRLYRTVMTLIKLVDSLPGRHPVPTTQSSRLYAAFLSGTFETVFELGFQCRLPIQDSLVYEQPLIIKYWVNPTMKLHLIGCSGKSIDSINWIFWPILWNQSSRSSSEHNYARCIVILREDSIMEIRCWVSIWP